MSEEDIPVDRAEQNPTLRLGQVVLTRNAANQLTIEGVQKALQRHASGDWGDLDIDDWQANEEALELGFRLLSVYRDISGTPFWIITEADRSVTTVLLPEDY